MTANRTQNADGCQKRTVRICASNRTQNAYFEDRVFRRADGRLRASAAPHRTDGDVPTPALYPDR
jgi:hypothetical protein